MLGYDLLVMQGAHWYFDRKTLLLHGKEIPLHHCTSRSSVSWVYAREHVVVSPNAEQNVPVKCTSVRASVRTPKLDWLLQPNILAKGIHVARVLLPDTDRCAAVCMANLTS